MKNVLLWMAAYTLLYCCSQVILKFGLNQIGGLSFSSTQLVLNSCLQIVRNPLVVSGTLMMIFASILWLFILSWFNIGVVLPLTALANIFTGTLATLVLGEGFGFYNYLGIALIALGINFLLR
jgi:drug/metabolite transporter (DMT)-like permease